MGEEPHRVHRVGAPSLDHLRRRPALSDAAFEARLGAPVNPSSLLVAYHPVTVARDTLREADEMFAALGAVDRPVVFCFPNADAGSRELIDRARAFCEARPGASLHVNLNPETYWALLRRVATLVGNSSSGIMEAPSLALPTVNVGMRQQGRERARNIIDAPPDRARILEALDRAYSPEFRQFLDGMTNPYGDGRASERIVRILGSLGLGEDLLVKRAVS
jgi:UDP-N-acetylglucosamine 2-epimerase (non-hydrolysing)/GDP/UDP-N,N'-diacetylbacillosamine 2-epimerase (hydrolysing)